MSQDHEILQLEKAMKTAKERRMFERYQAVKLVLEGHSQKEVATIIGRNEHTVGDYMKLYRTHGLPGLLPGKSSGRPSRLTDEQQAELKEIIVEKTPDQVGFESRANWTLPIMKELIQRKWGISYSLKGLQQLLHRLGLSYTRPTYTLKKADPQKQKDFLEKTFKDLKKN